MDFHRGDQEQQAHRGPLLQLHASAPNPLAPQAPMQQAAPRLHLASAHR